MTSVRWTEADIAKLKTRPISVVDFRKALSRVREVREMNGTEGEYAQLLEFRRIAGEIAGWGFERIKLRLAGNTFYTPDFDVTGVGGETAFHEVKGFWRDDARVKIKVAAAQFPQFSFVAVQKARKRGGGGWKIERIR